MLRNLCNIDIVPSRTFSDLLQPSRLSLTFSNFLEPSSTLSATFSKVFGLSPIFSDLLRLSPAFSLWDLLGTF